MTSIGSLVRLEALVPPPDYPVRGDGDWKRFTSVNGFPPPEDYRMLIREYGAGTFAGWVRLIEPFSMSRSFIDLVEVECLKLRRNGSTGWPVWPEFGGFLPWATTAGGDHIGWRTDRRPNEWTAAFWGRGGKGIEFDLDAIDFLVGLAEGSLSVDDVGNPFKQGRTPFRPADD